MATKMTGAERLEHMRRAIREGGSALYNGRVIMTLGQLPNLTELASSAEEREQAGADLERRKQEILDEELRFNAEHATGTATGEAAPGQAPAPATTTVAKPPATSKIDAGKIESGKGQGGGAKA